MTDRTLELSELSHQKLALLASGLEQDRDELIALLREWKQASLSGMDPFDGPEYIDWCDQFERRVDELIAKYRVPA